MQARKRPEQPSCTLILASLKGMSFSAGAARRAVELVRGSDGVGVQRDAVDSSAGIYGRFSAGRVRGTPRAVMKAIGDSVAILQGTTERPGEQPFRQSNQFFYLTGVVEPRAILLIDGRKKTSTLFLKPRDERREKMMFGPGLYPGPEAVRATGIEAVLPRDDFRSAVANVAKDGVDDLHAVSSGSAWVGIFQRHDALWHERRKTISGMGALLAKRRFAKS